MAKIIGNTTATPNPRPDWAQTDENKADYIKNKPMILTEDDVISLISENGGTGGSPEIYVGSDNEEFKNGSYILQVDLEGADVYTESTDSPMRVKDANGNIYDIPAFKGDKGDKGVGVSKTEVNSDNELIITYTDGTTENAGVIQVRGEGSASCELSLLGEAVLPEAASQLCIDFEDGEKGKQQLDAYINIPDIGDYVTLGMEENTAKIVFVVPSDGTYCVDNQYIGLGTHTNEAVGSPPTSIQFLDGLEGDTLNVRVNALGSNGDTLVSARDIPVGGLGTLAPYDGLYQVDLQAGNVIEIAFSYTNTDTTWYARKIRFNALIQNLTTGESWEVAPSLREEFDNAFLGKMTIEGATINPQEEIVNYLYGQEEWINNSALVVNDQTGAFQMGDFQIQQIQIINSPTGISTNLGEGIYQIDHGTNGNEGRFYFLQPSTYSYSDPTVSIALDGSYDGLKMSSKYYNFMYRFYMYIKKSGYYKFISNNPNKAASISTDGDFYYTFFRVVAVNAESESTRTIFSSLPINLRDNYLNLSTITPFYLDEGEMLEFEFDIIKARDSWGMRNVYFDAVLCEVQNPVIDNEVILGDTSGVTPATLQFGNFYYQPTDTQKIYSLVNEGSNYTLKSGLTNQYLRVADSEPVLNLYFYINDKYVGYIMNVGVELFDYIYCWSRYNGCGWNFGYAADKSATSTEPPFVKLDAVPAPSISGKPDVIDSVRILVDDGTGAKKLPANTTLKVYGGLNNE